MKTLLLYFVTLLASLASAEEFQPSGWSLTTVFPGTAIIKESTPFGMCSYIGSASVSTGRIKFSLSRLVFSRIPHDIEGSQQAVKTATIAAKKGRLVSEEKITVCGYPALRYVIETADGKKLVEARDVALALDSGFEDYILEAEYDASQAKSEDLQAFFSRCTLAANQALLPTTTAVTSPAGQEPRQPKSSAHLKRQDTPHHAPVTSYSVAPLRAVHRVGIDSRCSRLWGSRCAKCCPDVPARAERSEC